METRDCPVGEADPIARETIPTSSVHAEWHAPSTMTRRPERPNLIVSVKILVHQTRPAGCEPGLDQRPVAKLSARHPGVDHRPWRINAAHDFPSRQGARCTPSAL